MTVGSVARPRPANALQRFFKTPKGYFLIVLALLTALAAIGEGVPLVIPGLIGATGAAVVTDAAIVWYFSRALEFPSGGLLTGLIVALVFSPQEQWYVPMSASILAIVAKHLLRTRSANVFNPAAVGIILSTLIFASGESWWGALPNLPPVALVVLIASGFLIANHINKLPLILMFLATYYGLFTASSFLADPAQVAEIFRSPDVNAVLFFAFFMLDDPPTSPVRYGDQLRFGLIVAVASFAVYFATGAAYYLLAGVLVGNAWEAYRRVSNAKPLVSAVAG